MGGPGFTVDRVGWDEARAELSAVRQVVFVEEQGVPPELEWSEGDEECLHLLARARDGSPIGTGRLHPRGRIGRLAVLPAWRGQGVGTALLRELLRIACEIGLESLVLHAQTRAVAFYEPHGFVAEGEEFLDGGITHRAMRLRLG